nr:MAG TPA: tail protein [Caudoviricetes sp.]
MADKSIEQLNAAEKVYLSDLFVLQQSGTAKKLTGQVLKNWLLELAQGHGGITSIVLQSTSGLSKVYRITLADDTYFDMTVADGRGITGVAKTGTAGLVDTYTMKFNAGSDFVFTVKNGEKGDKGDADRLYFKFASQKPTDASHSMGDVPDEWLGFYAGTTPPSGWQDYTWVRIKGDKGDKGDAARLTSHSTTYMISDSGTIVPSGSWVADVPNVPQGKYLWTRTVLTFNTGNPVTFYSVSRFGLDGTGAVSSVNGKDPDPTGNVRIQAEDITTSGGQSVQAVLDKTVKTVNSQEPDDTGDVTVQAEHISTTSGKTVEQELSEKQPKINTSGLLKGTGNGGVAAADHGVDYQLPVTSVQVTLPAAGWQNNAQAVTVSGVTADSSVVVSPAPESFEAYNEAECRATAQGAGTITFSCGSTPSVALTVNVMIINK